MTGYYGERRDVAVNAGVRDWSGRGIARDFEPDKLNKPLYILWGILFSCKMRGRKAAFSIAIVLLLLLSGASAFFTAPGHATSRTVQKPTGAEQHASTQSIGQTSATEYLTSTSAQFPPSSAVWEGNSVPQTSLPKKGTTITYSNTSLLDPLIPPVYSGFTLFEPGKALSANQTANSSIPVPTDSNAFGWLSYLQQSSGQPITIASGNWTFNVGVNVTSPAGSPDSGKLYVGMEAFAYNSTGTFSRLFGGENSSLNLYNASAKMYMVSISVDASRISFTGTQGLFVEYYLNASSFTPSNSIVLNFSVGGSGGAAYNFTYPDFGWVTGQVHPASAGVTLNGQQVVVNSSGGFNVSVEPSYYTVIASLPGYVNFTKVVDVNSSVSSHLNISLAKLYTVEFSEKGLQQNTIWSVDFNGSTYASQGRNISFSSVNGTYTYKINPVSGYSTVGNSSSSVTVSGANVTIPVTFRQINYTLAFNESGLGTGVKWEVVVNNSTFAATYNSTSSAIQVSLPNGTYSYVISPVPGYVLLTSPGGNITVAGLDINISVWFKAYKFNISFTESGLPAGTNWSVSLGYSTLHSTLGTVTFSEPNGTYNYSIGAVAGYMPAPAGGSITVRNASAAVKVDFTQVKYNISFSELGLPASSNWSVELNGTVHNSTDGSIFFEEPNGTYYYTVLAEAGYRAMGSHGQVRVDNSSVYVNLTFTLIYYRITFTESGLPSNTAWSVTVDGETNSTSGSAIVFLLPNGSYSFSVSKIEGYALKGADRNITVNGNNSSFTIAFEPVSAGPMGISSGTWFFIIIIAALVALEIVIGALYIRSRKGRGSHSQAAQEEAGAEDTGMTVTQILGNGGGNHANGHAREADHSPSSAGGEASAQVLTGLRKEDYGRVIEPGNSYAVFEQTAQSSLDLFTASLAMGYAGLCFTRQYPEKISQKFPADGSSIYWLSNIGSDNAIRPKDLEKITLQCNEYLSKSRSVILIDGLEYLITNNGFITVLKMLQYLRDAAAVKKSIMILSINPNAISENEVNLIMREVDKVIR